MADDDSPADWDRPSAFAGLLGLHMTHWAENEAHIEATLVPKLFNRHGMPHGGLHASMLDTAMGYAGCYTGQKNKGQMCVTLSLTLNYVAATKGERLIAIGRRIGGGRTTFFADGQLTDDTGRLIATATGVFRYISKT